MNYHLRTTPSTRKRNRKKGGSGVVFEKLDKANFKSSNKIPTYQPPRDDPTRNIPSLPMSFDSAPRESIMERVLRGEETEEVRNEVVRKSMCLAPAYNKGALQYIGSEEEAKTVGRK